MSIAAPATNPASDLELKLPATIGTAGQYLTVDGSGNLTWANPPGVTEADQWVVTADFSSDDTVLTSNWGRPSYTEGSVGKVGTGMSQSSGVFTFPSTGIWHIHFHTAFSDTDANRVCNVQIQTTADDSNYTTISQFRTSNYQDSNTWFQSGVVNALLDVTNTTNQKVRFRVTSLATAVSWQGHSERMDTGAIFIRLGDT